MNDKERTFIPKENVSKSAVISTKTGLEYSYSLISIHHVLGSPGCVLLLMMVMIKCDCVIVYLVT